MSTKVGFRIFKDNAKIKDTEFYHFPHPQAKDVDEFIGFTFDRLKKEYPNHEIMVVCEVTARECHSPLTNLSKEDLLELVRRTESRVQ
jgi:hypothetical protein